MIRDLLNILKYIQNGSILIVRSKKMSKDWDRMTDEQKKEFGRTTGGSGSSSDEDNFYEEPKGRSSPGPSQYSFRDMVYDWFHKDKDK